MVNEMSLESWIIYLALVIAATATPGPAVLFIVTNSALYGWKNATYIALGNIAGLMILGIVAISGLGTILNASASIFNVIKYFGAAYLFYLGVKLIFQKTSGSISTAEQIIPSEIKSNRLFVQALLVAVSNPKAIVFLTALFPQFINTHSPLFGQCLVLLITLMLFSFSFLMFYAFLAQRTKNWLGEPNRIKYFNRSSGAVFIGFGILLATSSNK